MKTFKFFLGAFTIMASSILVDAQVRSTGNSNRGNSDKATVNQVPSRSTQVAPVRTAPNSNSSIRSNDSSVKSQPTRTTQPAVATQPTRSTNANVRTEPTRATQETRSIRSSENTVKPVRATQNGNTSQSVRNNNTKSEEIRTVRVEQVPKAETFERRSVRYENNNNNSDGVIYLSNNRREHVHKVKYNQHDYYMDNGYYYQWYNNNYRLIPAPIGFRMSSLPYGYHNMYIGGTNYYYFNGTYYNYYDNYYQVVQPPMGAIVYDLPMYAQRIFINGRKYYEYFGVVYKRIHYYGERVYQVVGYLN